MRTARFPSSGHSAQPSWMQTPRNEANPQIQAPWMQNPPSPDAGHVTCDACWAGGGGNSPFAEILDPPRQENYATFLELFI